MTIATDKKPSSKLVDDVELIALSKILKLLNGLDGVQQQRIVQYTVDKYGLPKRPQPQVGE